MAAKKKKKAAPRGKTCVVFRRATKGGRKIAPKEVCFKSKELSPEKKRAKAARAKRVLKAFACKAVGAPKKACAKLRRA